MDNQQVHLNILKFLSKVLHDVANHSVENIANDLTNIYQLYITDKIHQERKESLSMMMGTHPISKLAGLVTGKVETLPEEYLVRDLNQNELSVDQAMVAGLQLYRKTKGDKVEFPVAGNGVLVVEERGLRITFDDGNSPFYIFVNNEGKIFTYYTHWYSDRSLDQTINPAPIHKGIIEYLGTQGYRVSHDVARSAALFEERVLEAHFKKKWDTNKPIFTSTCDTDVFISTNEDGEQYVELLRDGKPVVVNHVLLTHLTNRLRHEVDAVPTPTIDEVDQEDVVHTPATDEVD